MIPDMKIDMINVPNKWILLALVLASLSFSGCQTTSSLGPIRTATEVDLDRFMGDWYVIAAIPTFLEKEAYNAIETYERGEDDRILTTFKFRKGGFDGPEKVYNPVGFVREGTGDAVWGMQFVWPIKAEYRVVYVDDAYALTVIGRTKRDFVWVMARTPTISDESYERMLKLLEEEGYDLSKLRKVPHRYDEV